MSDVGNKLFDDVVAASGLSTVFGGKALARALQRIGVDPHALTRRDLETSMPALEKALSVFLKPGEIKSRMASIEKLLS